MPPRNGVPNSSGQNNSYMTYQSKSTVSTHTVASDANAASVQLGEGCENGLRQLFGHVAVHVVAGVVGRFRGINVEAGTGAEVVCIVLALDVQTSFEVDGYVNYWLFLFDSRILRNSE